MKTAVFLMRSAPYTSLRAREGLEAALALAAFDGEPHLVFLGEGVLQLLPQADQSLRKNHSKMLQALPLYGIEHCHVHLPSLQAKGLTLPQLILPCTPMDNTSLAQRLAQAHVVLNF